MANYSLKVKAVIDKQLKVITGSYTFTDPVPFTVYLPAYLYNDKDKVLVENDLVLIREQKDNAFNAIAFWGGQYADNGHKILYAETKTMAAAVLTIINKDHVYIRYRGSSKNSKNEYYQFAYELNSKELLFFFAKTHKGCHLKPLNFENVNAKALDDFDDLFTQVRIAKFIYRTLHRILRKDPNKLLAVIIQENPLLKQQLGTVDSVSCDNFRCARKRIHNKVH